MGFGDAGGVGEFEGFAADEELVVADHADRGAQVEELEGRRGGGDVFVEVVRVGVG